MYNIWQVASEALHWYYMLDVTCVDLAGHLFFTDTVVHNGKTDNDRQIVNKQHAAAEINQMWYKKENRKIQQHKRKHIRTHTRTNRLLIML